MIAPAQQMSDAVARLRSLEEIGGSSGFVDARLPVANTCRLMRTSSTIATAISVSFR